MLENLQTLTLDTDPMNTKFTTTKEVMAAPVTNWVRHPAD
jgi:hypothetical protein